MLGVAGGFWDGTSTIVEPLTRLCWMFEDNTQMRQNHLASLLYALRNGVHALGRYAMTSCGSRSFTKDVICTVVNPSNARFPRVFRESMPIGHSSTTRSRRHIPSPLSNVLIPKTLTPESFSPRPKTPTNPCWSNSSMGRMGMICTAFWLRKVLPPQSMVESWPQSP